MSSIHRSSRRKRKTLNTYHTLSSAEEKRLLRQAIELSKVDQHLDKLSVPFGPTFYPSVEEFEDNPINYIDKIRPIAEKYGICKIVPPEGWNPPFCVDMTSKKKFQTKKQLLRKIQEGEAFDDGKEYTPGSFLKMANDFTTKWRITHYPYHKNANLMQCKSEVDNNSSAKCENDSLQKQQMSVQNLERDYWRVVEGGFERVAVEYGNDIDTEEYWSGFPLSELGRSLHKPKVKEKPLSFNPKFGTDEFYKESWWNVNNISNCPGSVLCRVKAGINGINIPWLYFGSLFTTFCWHNEDNYLYSINYHHKGAPKLWYGVPGTRKDAESLERVFKNHLSKEMHETPDLLHHITTMFSPRLLQQGDTPVYKLVQYSGEYIITFPRAFHGGFSLGPNIGEAVNFASNDWIMHGAEANERYRSFSRVSVFSHDRFIVTMANHLNEQTKYSSCLLLYNELLRIVTEEVHLRTKCLDSGIRDISASINLPKNRLDQVDNECTDYDDKRLCHTCKHACFFSAIACVCSQTKVSCLRHSNYHCRCKNDHKYMLVWSQVKELYEILASVKKHCERLKAQEVKTIINNNENEKVSCISISKLPDTAPGSLSDLNRHQNDDISVPLVFHKNTAETFNKQPLIVTSCSSPQKIKLPDSTYSKADTKMCIERKMGPTGQLLDFGIEKKKTN